MEEYVKINNLVKNYGNVCAVDTLSIEVKKGEIFGLLGPNGAGKSTTINIVTTLTEYDKGTVTIAGMDTVRDRDKVKRIIGVVPQEIALHPFLTAYENVSFFASLYGLKGKNLKEASKRALAFVGLSEKENMRMDKMSGGMKRRLNIACGIAHSPQLIVMDEPTVGVDAQSRDHILHSIQTLRKEGATVIYTSHYMNEVEEICDRIAIVDRGKLVACGTKRELVSLVTDRKQYIAKVKIPDGFSKDAFRNSMLVQPDVLDVSIQAGTGRCTIQIDTSNEFDNFMVFLDVFKQYQVEIRSINSQVPDLDSLFLILTGTEIR